MSFGDHVETRSELEASELERENRVSFMLAGAVMAWSTDG